MNEDILKVDFTYNKKLNKVQISAIFKDCILYTDHIFIKEDSTNISIKNIEILTIENKNDYTNFIYYTFKMTMSEAENFIMISAFDYFNEINDEKACKKIASYIKIKE